MNGLYVRLTHTGVFPHGLQLQDIYPTTDGHTAHRRAGPVYIPVGETVELTYTGEVAASFESGTIRGFVGLGYLLAEVRFGDGVAYIRNWSGAVPGDDTVHELFLDGVAEKRLLLSDNTAQHFKIRVVAIDSGTSGQVAWWDVTGGIYRGADPATTTLVGANVAATQNMGGNSANWVMAALADNLHGSLVLRTRIPASAGLVKFMATGYLTPVSA